MLEKNNGPSMALKEILHFIENLLHIRVRIASRKKLIHIFGSFTYFIYL